MDFPAVDLVVDSLADLAPRGRHETVRVSHEPLERRLRYSPNDGGIMDTPSAVQAATKAAANVGFAISCHADVGRLLRVLAAAVRPDGAILELGTGVGVGLAWIVSGLGGRTDVHVLSVELDPDTAATAAKHEWPSFVRLELGDALDILRRGDHWDLIFADTLAGKWEGLDDTLEALSPGGVLLVDDMTPPIMSEIQRTRTIEVRNRLLTDPSLVAVEMRWSSGIIVCARRHDA
jgi:demethylmenaquinone methyltransferase/2-methoxy-6-polyprenyl-1,4-benzoquinol methylase